MIRYTARRVASALLLTVAVTSVTFALVFSNGPGIARAVLGETATQSAVDAKAVQLGLDQPLLQQYGRWLADLVTGSLGTSFYTGEAVTEMMSTRIPVTLSLAAIVLVLTTLLSVLVGTVAAVRGGIVDRVLQFLAVLGTAVPSFVIAVLLVLVLAIGTGLLPATGYISPTSDPGGWASSLVLPVLAVLIGSVGGAAQQFRGAVADVLRQEFVRTLRSRGIDERRIVLAHVLRSAAAPGLTILGLQTIGLLGGVVIIEKLFALPGVGDLAVEMTLRADIPVVMGCVVFTIGIVVVVNLLTDLVGAWLNPKARTV